MPKKTKKNSRTNGRRRVRFPTPDEMDALDSIMSINQMAPSQAVADWRKMRQLCNRMKYEERRGEPHPAWAGEDEIDPLTREEFDLEPPEGMLWADFGLKWDLAPEPNEVGEWEPLKRHEPITQTWNNKVRASSEVVDLTQR